VLVVQEGLDVVLGSQSCAGLRSKFAQLDADADGFLSHEQARSRAPPLHHHLLLLHHLHIVPPPPSLLLPLPMSLLYTPSVDNSYT